MSAQNRVNLTSRLPKGLHKRLSAARGKLEQILDRKFSLNDALVYLLGTGLDQFEQGTKSKEGKEQLRRLERTVESKAIENNRLEHTLHQARQEIAKLQGQLERVRARDERTLVVLAYDPHRGQVRAQVQLKHLEFASNGEVFWHGRNGRYKVFDHDMTALS